MIRSLRSLVRYRVKHPKRNPICTCAHYYLSVRLSAKSPRTDKNYLFTVSIYSNFQKVIYVLLFRGTVRKLKKWSVASAFKSTTAVSTAKSRLPQFGRSLVYMNRPANLWRLKRTALFDRSAKPQLSFLRALYSTASVWYTESFITLSVCC